jgi:hypothetical protein
LKVTEDVGGPLNDFANCLTIVMRCATIAKDENKEILVLDFFHKYLDTSVLLVCILILFHSLLL